MKREVDNLQKFKMWEVRPPQWVMQLTPAEIYIQGFSSGYRCKEDEVERQHIVETPIYSFNFGKKVKEGK